MYWYVDLYKLNFTFMFFLIHGVNDCIFRHWWVRKESMRSTIRMQKYWWRLWMWMSTRFHQREWHLYGYWRVPVSYKLLDVTIITVSGWNGNYFFSRTKDNKCQYLCVNTIGSHTCECPKGFVKHRNTCVDRDEVHQKMIPKYLWFF